MVLLERVLCFFFFNDTATTEIYTLSLHDALPIFVEALAGSAIIACRKISRFIERPQQKQFQGSWLTADHERSEEHTSELQSPCNLVCRLLLEKKKHHANNVYDRSMRAFLITYLFT